MYFSDDNFVLYHALLRLIKCTYLNLLNVTVTTGLRVTLNKRLTVDQWLQ